MIMSLGWDESFAQCADMGRREQAEGMINFRRGEFGSGVIGPVSCVRGGSGRRRWGLVTLGGVVLCE